MLYASSKHGSSGYIDDSYLQGDGFADSVTNIKATVLAFDSLGLIAHQKTCLNPYAAANLSGVYLVFYRNEDFLFSIKE